MQQPKHSDKYLIRLNNPKGNFKSEQHHIDHFKARLKERFDLEASTDEYYELVKVASISKKVYSLAATNTFKQIEFKGKVMWVLYAPKIDWQDQHVPARLKTVVIPFEKYSVPLALAHIYDTETFTKAVRDTLYEFVLQAKRLDLENRKEFFLLEDIPVLVKHGALKFKRDCMPERNNADLVSIAIKHLNTIHNVPVLD